MTASVETLTSTLSDLQDALAKARKAKKATAPIKAQIVEVEAQIEQVIAEAEKITAEAVVEKRPVGRPRTKAPAFYELRDSLKRGEGRRGRPSRAQVEADLRTLGVSDELSHLSMREVEQMLKTVREVALAKAAVA